MSIRNINRAAAWNIASANGLKEVLRSNIGPTGTLKMLVSGAGDIRITKDGARLLSEMQIMLPTAILISRSATAIDDQMGDGTSSICVILGEILKVAERYLNDGIHPRSVVDGLQEASKGALEVLDRMRIPLPAPSSPKYREMLTAVARTSLGTKVHTDLAALMTDIVVDAVLTIFEPGKPLDLNMVEVMHMQHRLATESRLVKGLVLDHGCRHPDMPHELRNCYVLVLNVSLEYEKSEVNATYAYASAEQRDKLTQAERHIVDEKVKKVIDLKRKVCKDGEHFVVINQKGIDPLSLDAFAKEGVMALRRAKRRNMERLVLACGGAAVNSVDDLTPDVLGWAGYVHEHQLGEEKYTFVEDVRHPQSCTVLVKGPNPHVIGQVKDALRDGLRALQNVLSDGCVVPGAGAFEIAASAHLQELAKKVPDNRTVGVQTYAEALLVIPKVLAENSGFDALESLIKLQREASQHPGNTVGFDTATGEVIDPVAAGIFDNYCVKRQILTGSAVIASQLLLVDDVLKAGKAGAPGDRQTPSGIAGEAAMAQN